MEIVKRSDDVKEFQVLPHRWIIELTFGWLGRYRRLSKDYEILTESSQALIYAAMIHIMIRRLSRIKSEKIKEIEYSDSLPGTTRACLSLITK